MHSRANPIVRIVDDDAELRQTLEYLLKAEGWETVSYSSAEQFLIEDARSVPGCVILDVRMGGMSGLELQRELNRQGCSLPIIFFSAHGDIEMAVHTVKAGAENFLPKTVDSEKLLEAVDKAVRLSLSKVRINIKSADLVEAFNLLTEKELEVVRLLAKGLLNKEIAARLGITPKTIYGHRVQIYRKLNVRSTAEICSYYREWTAIKENSNV